MEAGKPDDRLLAYERLVDSSPSLFAVVDRQYRYRMANAAYLRVRGLEADQTLGRHTLPEVLGPEAFERARPHLERSFAGEVSRYADWFTYPRMGPRFMEVNYYPLVGRGQPGGAAGGSRADEVVVEIHDATDRKRAEEALLLSEARNRAILAAIPDQIVRLRRDGVYLEVLTPPGFESTMDLDKRPGKHVRDALPPDRAERVLNALEAAFVTGRVQTLEYQVPLPDGRMRDREARILVTVPDEALVLARDVTDRKQAERALRESEERYRLHFEQANDVIYSLDLDNRITSISPSVERILGYRPQELIGRRLEETGLLSAEEMQRSDATKAQVRAGERPTTEYRMRAKDGTLRWGEASGAPLVKDGRIVGGLIIGRDITLRKAAEESLRTLNAELEERVSSRTAALAEANRRLQGQIAEREQTEASLRRALDRLREFESEVLLAEERERRQLASDLHDSPVQALTVAKMKLSQLGGLSRDPAQKSALAELGDLVDQACGSIRSLTFQLSPPILYDLGLAPALEWLAGDFSEKARPHLEVTVEDDGQSRLASEPVKVILFRCVRELLINVVKHASAREARIEVRRSGETLLVTVEDDGRGFKYEHTYPHEPGRPAAEAGGDAKAAGGGQPAGGSRGAFGLFSIGERLSNMGGSMKIRSAPGTGTAVTLEVPLLPDKGGAQP